jgi:hypothetical protein
MFILYFDGIHFEYYHGLIYERWLDYPSFRPGEGFWLVPGTDPEDRDYGRFEQSLDDDETQGDENDETLEYMVDLLEAGEVEPSEFRHQLLSVGYDPETISEAIAQVAA